MILEIKENNKLVGAFHIDTPEQLARQSQVIKTSLGIIITIRPTHRAPVKEFMIIGMKPGSQVVEELGRMVLGEYINIPAGTKVLKVERIIEGTMWTEKL